MYVIWHAGLQKYTEYNARIAASTVHGRGPLSNMTVFQTYEDSKYYQNMIHYLNNTLHKTGTI